MRAHIRTVALLATLLTSSTPALAELPSVDPSAEAERSAYWLRHREGWFWYRDPPAPPTPPKPVPKSDPPPRELVDFEAMQKRLDELKRVAVMNPSDTNLLAYMRYQRHVMNKSQVFAERWQRLVWTVPDVDYAMSGRPTNAMAIAAYDEQQRDRQGQAVRALAKTHTLLFIFRSDCPYCHRLAPILKRFEQAYGMTVFPVSLDGRGLPEYPNPQADNGVAARLNASVVPALYLTTPARREIQPVGFGVMALTDLVERIAALGTPNRNDPL